MMLKERSNKWAKLKLAFLLPAVTTCIYAFAQPEVNEVSKLIESTSINESTTILSEDKMSKGEAGQYPENGSKKGLSSTYKDSQKKKDYNHKEVELRVNEFRTKINKMIAAFHKEEEIRLQEMQSRIKQMTTQLENTEYFTQADKEAKMKEIEATAQVWEKERETRAREMEDNIQREEEIFNRQIEALFK